MNCWRKRISFAAGVALGIGGAAAAPATNEQPQVKQMYFQENFANNQLSTTWVFDQTSGSISVEDQALKIKRTQSEGTETIADLYMNANKSVYRGNLGLEFTITKSASKLMYFQMCIRDRGHDDYIEAAKILKQHGLNVKLIAAGTGSREKELKDNPCLLYTSRCV